MQINKKKQFERVIKRKNMTLKLLNDINLNQISSKQKKYADFIVNNNNSKQETKKKLQSIFFHAIFVLLNLYQQEVLQFFLYSVLNMHQLFLINL